MSIDKSNSSCATDGINPSCSASFPAEEKDDWIVEDWYNGSVKVGELRIHKPTKELRIKCESGDWIILNYDDKTLMNWRLADPEMDKHNWNVLNCAIVMGSTETVRWLIEHDIKETGYKGRNCVLTALCANRIEIVEYLHSIDNTLIMAREHDGNTALCLATQLPSKDMVEYLITELKVDRYETGYKGRNCVLTAARTDKLEMLKYLHSIDHTLIMARDDDGDTALCLAGRNASKKTVEYLITELKVDIHETGHLGHNCILAAITRDKIDNVIYLNSIDPMLIEAITELEETAWNMAVEYNSEHSVEFLINRPFLDEGAIDVFDDEVSCVVCLDALPGLIFLPCKHRIVCKNCVENCFEEFKNCPMCKSKIDFVYTLEESDKKRVKRLEKEIAEKNRVIAELGEQVRKGLEENRRLKYESDEKAEKNERMEEKNEELTELLSKIGLLLKENKNSNEGKVR